MVQARRTSFKVSSVQIASPKSDGETCLPLGAADFRGEAENACDSTGLEASGQKVSPINEKEFWIRDVTLSNIVDFAYSFDKSGRFLFVNKPLLDLW